MWRGIPYKLLDWAEKDVLTIYTSLDILMEVHRVLHYPKLQKFIDREHTSPVELFSKIESLCTVVQTDQKIDPICSDPDDDKFLSCALSANVRCLVFGDKQWTDTGRYAFDPRRKATLPIGGDKTGNDRWYSG